MQAVRSVSDLTAEMVGNLVEQIRVHEDQGIRVKFTFSDVEFSSADLICEKEVAAS